MFMVTNNKFCFTDGRPIKHLIDCADIVFGRWPNKEGGVSAMLIKGEPALRECIASGVTFSAWMKVLEFMNHAHALAAKQAFGDLKP
jgi:hypothetical protein